MDIYEYEGITKLYKNELITIYHGERILQYFNANLKRILQFFLLILFFADNIFLISRATNKMSILSYIKGRYF